MDRQEKLYFSSDYMEGAHPDILKRLVETNMEKSAGYGFDEYSESAREKIRNACNAKEAEVFFLVGGTQTNATLITALLRPYQGVIAPRTGHISVHEAGAIEFGGHKVLELPEKNGKISPEDIESCAETYWQDMNHEHMVMPGMVYISQPTEYGSLYSLEELKAIKEVCRKRDLYLYMDGARLAYALSCPENDLSLPDIASLCDAFYIGGTKCGALLGEALVIPKKDTIPHFFSIIKQQGALLAKGRIAGIQFDTLFTEGLYYRIGESAISAAERVRQALIQKGYELAFDSPTNQIFVLLEKSEAERLSSIVEMGFWENVGSSQCIMRIATSWATQPEDVDRLIELL